MNEFEKWLAESFSYTSPEARESMRLGFIGGLRRAAEIARYRAEHSQDPDYCAGASGACNDIEQEATRIESEGE